MLTGEAKKDYQRAYMKEYMRNRRNVKTSLRPQFRPNQAELRKLLVVKPKEEPIPLYNPTIHKPGDRVMVKPNYGKKLVEIVIPELDDDGNPFT
ncbi:hypothetical protein LCGC14_0387500 [marine sediment metagenome]|uniref:Uncharacterized protein n=1 Tax=marine sediment metagenome TaxID=412755 RepID=A0A0F9W9D7_9ZZZZ